jgi:putative ABC transport system permease protein
MSGFSLVLIAILLIAVVKDELLGSWQQQLPEDIPNYFLINIRSDDIAAVGAYMQQHGIEASTPYALARARLRQINSIDVDEIDFLHPRADHMARHTFNITHAREIPDQNEIVAGEWLDADDPRGQLSVEQGMADRLELEIGDELTLTVGSKTLRAPVTSIRTVVWENFKPNFYLLIEEQNKADLKLLLKQFPSITLLDITELMARVRNIVDKASVALQFFFLFALASALIVLLAAIQTGRHEREIESSLLRALSAHTNQLYRVHVLEFTLMGALIGFFSACFATAAGWLISVQFFNIEFHFSASVWAYSLLSSCLVLTIAGIMVSRRVYNVSPMKILRS